MSILFQIYTASHQKKNFILLSENNQEIGKIIDECKFYRIQHSIEYQSQIYTIKNVGFLKNDLELSFASRIIYFTDLGKERIIKSGLDVRIFYFKLGKTNQLFEKGKLLIEIHTDQDRHSAAEYLIEADQNVDELLILLFLHYSTKEFNSIGGSD